MGRNGKTRKRIKQVRKGKGKKKKKLKDSRQWGSVGIKGD